MKIKRRHSQCLNCGQVLDRKQNFCPECGQENNDTNVSFNVLISEFLSTYLALDSSFVRTFKPFLTKPGFLTNEFNAGKRRQYANPVRLYLILSVFYFFVFTTFTLRSMKDNNVNFKTPRQLEAEDSVTYNEVGPFIKQSQKKKKSQADSLHNEEDTTSFVLNRLNWKLINDLKSHDEYSDQDILDSLHLTNTNLYEDYIAKQVIRLNRGGKESVTKFILQNLPLMMLIIIPLFAFFLKILYMRHKILYVKHIIHALHLHSFAYLIYGLGLVLLTFMVKGETMSAITWATFFIWVSLYAYFSFKRVYRQNNIITLTKFVLVGFSYLFLMFFFFLAEAFLSFLMY